MNASEQPRLDRDEADRVLLALGAAHDRISAAMYAVDTHPGLAAVRGDGLTGETARVADRARALVGLLWSHYAALGGVLDRARAVRARRSRPGDDELDELTGLLRAPVVRLGADGSALDDGTPGPVAERLALPELARRLETESAEIDRLLAGVEAARSRLAARFAPLTSALDRLRAETVALGDPDPAGATSGATATATGAGSVAAGTGAAGRLGAALDEIHRGALADPLAASGDGPAAGALDRALGELTAGIDALAARLADLARLRDGYPARAAGLRATLDEVAAAEETTARAYAMTLEKIADPGLPAVPDAVPALRSHLAQLDQFHREGRWARLADELATVERAASGARDRAERLWEAADGLLRRRAELRGRLEAYRAKAARLGLIEHTALADLHRTARDLLYTSPCDLPASTRAVVAYQRCLNDLTERPVPGRREPTQ